MALIEDKNMPMEPIKTLDCDQVAWLLDILERYDKVMRLSATFPSVSRLSEMAKYAAILEIAEQIHMGFDEDAKYNISPMEFRRTDGNFHTADDAVHD
jgi:hypothetical protein